MLENCSPKQRKFIKRFRAGGESGAEILQDLKVTPQHLARWMKNRSFRRLVDDAARALRLVTAWDMAHLAHRGVAVAKDLLLDDRSRTRIALQAMKQVGSDFK